MKKEIINYRRKRAKESLEEARIMFENVKLFATVNRIYYAIFYEAVALLLTKSFYSSKHSGIRSLFNREFVKTGVVGEESGDFFNKMFEFRQRGDYEDFVEFKKEDVNLWFKKAKEFIQAIEALRLGCKVFAQDLNPVGWFLVRKMVEPVDIELLKETFKEMGG